MPADLSVFRWLGCQQFVSLDILEWVLTTTVGVDHPLVLPYEPGWVGIPFHAQSLVLYTPEGVALTSGLAGVIGY